MRASAVVLAACLGLTSACGDKPVAALDAAVRDDASPDSAPADAVIDGAVDAMTDAPVSGTVEIIVYTWDGLRASNAVVVFQDADDVVIATAMTDGQGVATATVTAGSSVTARAPRRPGIAADTLYTFLAVEPGDRLHAGNPAEPAQPATFTAMVTLPGFAGAGSDLVAVRTRCGGGGGNTSAGVTTLPLAVSCSPVDIYVSWIDAATSQTLQSFLVRNVAVSAGQAIDLTAQIARPLRADTLTLTGIPASVTGGFFSASTSIGDFLFDEYLSHLEIAPPATNVMRVADVAAVNLGIIATLQETPESSQEIQLVAPLTGDVTMDVAALRIPWVTAGIIDTATHRVTWTESGAQAADLSNVELSIMRPGSDAITWRITGPHVPGVLELPVLGSSLSAFNPSATDTAQVSFVSIAKFSNGWDGRRGDVFRNLSSFHHRQTFAMGGFGVVSSSSALPIWTDPLQ